MADAIDRVEAWAVSPTKAPKGKPAAAPLPAGVGIMRTTSTDSAGSGSSRRSMKDVQVDVTIMSVSELASRLEKAGIPTESGIDREQMEHAVRADLQGGVPTTASDAFRKADIDSSGDLDMQEVKLLLATCGILLSPDRLVEVFGMMDIDGDGTIDGHEFEDYWATEIAPDLEINARAEGAISRQFSSRDFLGDFSWILG